MAGAVSPVVRGRRLAATLRHLRAESGRTVEEVASHLECSAAKVSRIENGLVGVRIQDARDLLDLYGIQGERREDILELVRQARGRGWWFPYTDVMAEGYERVLGFEDEAATISILETRLVPGLLQTEDYAFHIASGPRDVPPDVVDRRVRLRMLRRQILARPEPPHLRVVLDEAVLRRRIGTRETMAGQVRQLIADAQAEHISLRILLLDAEMNQASGFSFVIYGFTDPADPKVVYEELFADTVLYDSAEAAGRYSVGFDHAYSCALSESDSLQYLKELAADADAAGH